MEEFQLDSSNVNNEKNNNNKKAVIIATCSIIAILCFIVLIVVVFDSSPSGSSYLNMTNFNKITNGMTYEQVVDVLEDHDGTLDTSSSSGGYTLEYYTWTNADSTKIIVVGFENGRVCAKSQVGLR